MEARDAALHALWARKRGCRASPELAAVQRARAGDDQAFEALVRAYRDRILTLCHRIVGDRDAAEDVAQQSFVRAYQQLSRFRGEASFSTWLYAIAVNEARGYLRSRGRREARTRTVAETARCQQELRTTARPSSAPMTALLLQLPDREREALALFYLGDLSVAEIAGALRAPEGTVKSWLHRGRERLRQLAGKTGLLGPVKRRQAN